MKTRLATNIIGYHLTLALLFPCISMKLGTFVKWSFPAITNISARICLNIFGDSEIQSLKSGKNTKSGLVPKSRQEQLADLLLVFPARVKT